MRYLIGVAAALALALVACGGDAPAGGPIATAGPQQIVGATELLPFDATTFPAGDGPAVGGVCVASAVVPAFWADSVGWDCWADTPELAAAAIQAITSTQQAGADVVRIELSEPLAALPAGFIVQTPPRIAIDLPGVGSELERSVVEINQGNVRTVNVAQAGAIMLGLTASRLAG